MAHGVQINPRFKSHWDLETTRILDEIGRCKHLRKHDFTVTEEKRIKLTDTQRGKRYMETLQDNIMTDTYTQLYIRIIFAVKGRESFIPMQHKEALHQYITGIITHKKQTVIQINSMSDHLDILVGISPDVAISDLVREIKARSSKWINNKSWFADEFEWQTGFGAFSYAHSQLNTVVDYIKDPEAHYSHQTFREEYLGFLNRFDAEYVSDWEDDSET